MVKVSFKDGTTLEFDLSKDDDLQQWSEWSSVEDFQDKITSVGIVRRHDVMVKCGSCDASVEKKDGKFLTVQRPKRFKRVRWYVELVWTEKKGKKRLLGEKISCHADEVKYSLLVYTYKDPPPPILARYDVERVGKQMFPGSPVKAKG